MGSKSIIRSMSERDPFLHDNLQKQQYQENIHKAYLQLSQSITDILRPPTPEEEISVPSSRSKSRKKKSRKPRLSASSNLSVLSKYRTTPGLNLPASDGQSTSRPGSNRSRRSNRSRQSNFTKERKPRTRQAPAYQPPPSAIDPDRQRYSIRYSKVLDIFKKKIYCDIIKAIGMDINNLDDPSLVEIDLAWCKVGSYILESRENTFLSFQQFIDDTASMLSERDFDDKMSIYSGFSSYLPPIKGPGSTRSRSPYNGSSKSPVASDRRSQKGQKSYLAVDEKASKVPKLPVIGEHKAQ